MALSKNFKIKHVDIIDLQFFNKNKIENKILLKRNKKKYEISGKTFDRSFLIEELLNNDNKKDKDNQIDVNIDFYTNVQLNPLYLNFLSYFERM